MDCAKNEKAGVYTAHRSSILLFLFGYYYMFLIEPASDLYYSIYRACYNKGIWMIISRRIIYSVIMPKWCDSRQVPFVYLRCRDSHRSADSIFFVIHFFSFISHRYLPCNLFLVIFFFAPVIFECKFTIPWTKNRTKKGTTFQVDLPASFDVGWMKRSVGFAECRQMPYRFSLNYP